MLAKRLMDVREAKGLTREELARLSGITHSSIYSYEKGKRIPSSVAVFALSKALNISADYLLGLSNSESVPGIYSAVETRGTVKVLGKVSAGQGLEIQEDVLYTMPKLKNEDFDLVVQGNSMYPEVADGDLVLVRRQPQPDYDGQTCLVRVNGNDAVLKRFYHRPNGVMLKAANPEYDYMFIDRFRWTSDCELIGVVVGTVRLSNRDCP